MLFREIPDNTFNATFIKINGASFSVPSLVASAASWTVLFSHFPLSNHVEACFYPYCSNSFLGKLISL